jgi:glutamine amidotransferase
MIKLVDYGVGNINAFMNIYKSLGIVCTRATNEKELLKSEKIILPGVGAYDWAMKKLQASGMREILDELVLTRNVPILGICVGMQMMARRSDEGNLSGLGWISGEVKRFDVDGFKDKMRLPHMGWNNIEFKNNQLLKDLENPYFYFLHSYYFSPDSEDSILSKTDYFIRFASAVQNKHIFGVQFHPEKSHSWGIQLLKNFAKL